MSTLKFLSQKIYIPLVQKYYIGYDKILTANIVKIQKSINLKIKVTKYVFAVYQRGSNYLCSTI